MDPTQREGTLLMNFLKNHLLKLYRNSSLLCSQSLKIGQTTGLSGSKTVKTQTPRRGFVEEMSGREKYTSTMEKNLRRQIKIACVNRGIMFSEFIEEACREKLQREGMI